MNSGLPYNSFLVDDGLLCESPPDVMLSIKTLGYDISLTGIPPNRNRNMQAKCLTRRSRSDKILKSGRGLEQTYGHR